MKNQWKLITVIVLLLIIIIFAVMNVEQVPVNFGFGEIVAPLILIIFISLMLGSLITLLVSTITTSREHKEMKSLRQKINQQEQQTQDAVKRVRNEYEAKIRALEEALSEKEQQKLPEQESTEMEY